QRRNVLILGAGAGTEVSNALVHNVDSVVAVELHPDVVRIATGGRTGSRADGQTGGGQTGRRAGGLLGHGKVEWIVGDARSYVARTSRRFDLITLGATGGMGTAAAGVHSLGEDFLHTVDAYVNYLDHLTPDGVLAITHWLTIPLRENVRVILTAAAALHRASPETAAEGLFVMRSWATVTVLAKPSGFSAEDIDMLAAWSRVHGFDVDWYTGLDQPIGEFHLLEEPVPFEAAAAGTAGGDAAADFAAGYPFAVHPVSDARPYPHHFLRPSSVGAFLTSSRGTWLPFAEWGYIALVATLIQSIALAASLTIVPVALRARRAQSAFSLRLAGYFGAIGLAYLAAEIAAIQQLSLLLGHPIYAVAAVLAVFLICSGFGSLWSDRVAVHHGAVVLGATALLLLIHATVLLRLAHVFQSFPLPIRALAGMIEVAPVAFLMGLPFPLGLRTLAREDTTRTAWAWATNGFASVVAAPLAALIALEMGSPALFLVAAICYSLAGWIQHAAAGAVLQKSTI
ncbi:MAG: hypothetical protein O7F70_04990, partial [Gemmatimonadetes bacterium]|nr:hypothetical protein [Gemmatimonadota bacterium]